MAERGTNLFYDNIILSTTPSILMGSVYYTPYYDSLSLLD